MAISKKSIENMAKLLGVDKAKVKEALESETDVDIEVGEVVVLTKEGKVTLEKTKYAEGKEAGTEMGIKDYIKAFKKENNIEFEGNSLEAFVKNQSVITDVDGKIKKLQDNITTLTKEKEQVESKLSKVELLSTIHNSIPAEYNGMSKKELQAIAEANGFDFKNESGKLIPYRNGTKVVDEMTQKDVEATVALKNFFEVEKGFKVGAQGTDPADPKKGRGGQNDPHKGAKTMPTKRSEIEKEWTDANPGKSMNGEDYGTYYATKVNELRKEGQTVLMD